MDDSPKIINTGLRDVTVASTKICEVNGAEGRLIYRGYLVQDLAKNATFEEVAHLLLHEHLPTQSELSAFSAQLAKERALPGSVIDALKTRPKSASPMDILQAAVPMLANHDPDIEDTSREAALRMGIRLIAKFPAIVAAWERIRNDREVVDPKPDGSHAANFLHMMSGDMPNQEIASFMDAALVLHAEHAFNASTFAAREIASTRAHMYAAITGAVGSLSGELHGGANQRVMQMLLKIGSLDAVEDYVNHILDSGQKIMGLGHAVYKVDDPRAAIIAPMSKKMGEYAGETKWYEMSKVLEEKGKHAFKTRKGTDIFVNVDFYSASLYYSMGIPVDLFTPLFAISRIAGWSAHVLEEKLADAAPKAVLYRPESEYVGQYCGPEVCALVPIDKR